MVRGESAADLLGGAPGASGGEAVQRKSTRKRTAETAWLQLGAGRFSISGGTLHGADGRELGTVAEADGKMVGFVTVDPRSFDLDQIVVAPEVQGMGVAAALMTEAKRISPGGLDFYVNTDNLRAIQFYQKHGFVISGEALNWRSGAPVHKMSWRPPAA